MDELQYEQYSSIIKSGQLSLDALERIIKHDIISGWKTTPGELSRIQIAKDCDQGKINVKNSMT